MNKVTNIMQIDVEDWYSDLNIQNWNHYEDRVVQNTEKILSLLKKHNVQATFFVLGYVAEHFPDLVGKIKDDDHEVASHGYSHIPITKQSRIEFEKDLKDSLRALEHISGVRIFGYRAPQFSIVEETSWAIDILRKHGLKYDSSIFPVKTHLYGIPDAPLFPYHITSIDPKKDDPMSDFFEIPLSVYRIIGINKNIPIAGGFYLRLFPYWFISHAIKKINKTNHPAVCYLHPWEIDPKQPRINSLKWFHYYRLNNTEKQFSKLLKDFKFATTMTYINEER